MPTNAPGPEEPHRSVAPADFLQHVRGAAKLCGVTRLADITGLDRLGLPVWQAVRPAGWGLSVHQGKGASTLDAKIGALCEAIESHFAEQAPADGPCCELEALPAAYRPADITDYCKVREIAPASDERIQWCEATYLTTGAPQYLPHLLVSLDYRSGLGGSFERVSGGLGAGPREEDAVKTALVELIERDAAGEWSRRTPAERLSTSFDLASIPYEWFQTWRERLAALEVDLQIFQLPSIVGVPAFRCMIGAVEEFGQAYRAFSGTAAHADPEIALFKAWGEAVQSRLTLIAGVRDDISPQYYQRSATARRPVAGFPQGRRQWVEAEPLEDVVATVAERLAALGYSQIAVKRLDHGVDGVAVTRVFVPGLGSLTRTRRPGR